MLQPSMPGSTPRYVPKAPFTATFATTLSQDIVQTDTIPVDSTSASPVGVFSNPNAGGATGTRAMEALVVSGGLLRHAARDWDADGGWVLGAPVEGAAASEVVAGTAYSGTDDAAIYGIYQDDSALKSIQLQSDGTVWSRPATVISSVNTHLRSAYSPAGRLIVYATDASGNLAVAYQPTIGGAFATQTYAMPTPLSGGDYYLCLTDETSWTLAANAGSELWIYTGDLDGTSTAPSASSQAPNYSGGVNQIVLGYWSDYQSALMFAFLDASDTLQVWSSSGQDIVAAAPACPTGTVASATGQVYVDPETGIDSISIYTLDTSQNLSVLHQSRSAPWNSDGTPNWAAYIPIDTGIAGVSGDANPADVPALFALDAADYSLRLHQQDPSTRLWSTGQVLQSSSSSFEVTRFRAEVNIIDADGNLLPNQPVTVSVAPNYSALEIWAGGVVYPISSSAGADLTTDATGKLTLALLTTDLAASVLQVSWDGLAEPVSVPMAFATHQYLSGVGTLNPTNPPNPSSGAGPLDQFDAAGGTLAGATVNGTSLAPAAAGNDTLSGVAAAAIQQTAMVGLGTTAAGVAGYQATFAGPNGPTFSILPSTGDLEVRKRALLGSALDNGWSDIASFFSDVWHGIKNGIISIASFVVDIANKVVTFAVQVGDEIQSGIQVALHGMEHAAHFIAGVFSAIGAALGDLVDWLKGLFDFGAIWRTKMAFETALTTMPTYVNGLIQLGADSVDGWFGKQEKSVHDAFQHLIAKYEGQAFGQQPYFQPAGSAPNGTTPVAGNATVADFTSNVHHNWLRDKVAASGSGNLGLTPGDALATPWDRFSDNIKGSMDDFVAALKAFAKAIEATIQDPAQFGSVAIPDFLTAIENLVDSLLRLCDAIADSLMALATAAVNGFATMLTTTIDVSVLQSIWSWIAEAAGYPDDDQLDAAALMALLAAFPTTVAFKLIVGADQEPYPASSGAALGAVLGSSEVNIPELVAAILQAFYTVPTIAADQLNENCPTWLSVANMGVSALIFAIGTGYPDLSNIDWKTIPTPEIVWIVGLILYLIFVVQQLLWPYLDKIKAFAANNDAVSGLTTVYGVVSFVFHVVYIYLSAPNDEQVIASLLVPVPSIMAFCNLSTFRDDPEVAPFALGAKIAFDFIGYLGAGVAEIVDAFGNPSAAAGSLTAS